RGVPRAQAINDLLDNPQRLPSSLLFLNTLALLVSGSLALFASSHFVAWWAHPLAVVIAALVVLVFGVALPKSLALRNPERTALALYAPANTIRQLASPLVAVAALLAAPFVRILGGRTAPVGP